MISKIYTYLRTLSIDVALGATAMAYLVARHFQAELPIHYFIIVGLSVWLTYTLDHLMDAKKIRTEANTFRHKFHQTHFTQLMNVWSALLPVTVTYAFYTLPLTVISAGLLITVASGTYLLIVKYFGHRRVLFVQKELYIALIYTSGISFGPLCLQQSLAWSSATLLAIIFLLALTNLLVFSYYENFSDQLDKHTSFVQIFGVKYSQRLISFLLILNTIFIGYFLTNFSVLSILLFAMHSCLVFVCAFPTVFRKSERYRVLGDMIFLFPYVLCLI